MKTGIIKNINSLFSGNNPYYLAGIRVIPCITRLLTITYSNNITMKYLYLLRWLQMIDNYESVSFISTELTSSQVTIVINFRPLNDPESEEKFEEYLSVINDLSKRYSNVKPGFSDPYNKIIVNLETNGLNYES